MGRLVNSLLASVARIIDNNWFTLPLYYKFVKSFFLEGAVIMPGISPVYAKEDQGLSTDVNSPVSPEGRDIGDAAGIHIEDCKLTVLGLH